MQHNSCNDAGHAKMPKQSIKKMVPKQSSNYMFFLPISWLQCSHFHSTSVMAAMFPLSQHFCRPPNFVIENRMNKPFFFSSYAIHISQLSFGLHILLRFFLKLKAFKIDFTAKSINGSISILPMVKKLFAYKGKKKSSSIRC